jgi:hypothetical protein
MATASKQASETTQATPSPTQATPSRPRAVTLAQCNGGGVLYPPGVILRFESALQLGPYVSGGLVDDASGAVAHASAQGAQEFTVGDPYSPPKPAAKATAEEGEISK